MNARFEIVRTAAGWHARFRAANGEVVWWTENYTERHNADVAITALVLAVLRRERAIEAEVVDVDERAATS